MKSISIVLPCYNEEQAIPQVIKECLSLVDQPLNDLAVVTEVIVVDDGSRDKSLIELNRFESSALKVISHEKNKGYGAAIKTGVLASESELIAVFDLDSTCKASDLVKLVSSMEIENAEMAVGQRMAPDSGMPFIRNIGNWLFSLITKWIFNSKHHDVCSGYRLFKRESLLVYMSVLKDDLSFTLGASLKFLMDQRKIVSVPVEYLERTGESKLSALREGPLFLAQILSQWLLYRAR